MDESFIGLGIFLAGASSGALLKYMQDRRLLHLYGELVRQLSSALRQSIEAPAEVDAAAQARVLRKKAGLVREKSAS